MTTINQRHIQLMDAMMNARGDFNGARAAMVPAGHPLNQERCKDYNRCLYKLDLAKAEFEAFEKKI